MIWSWKEGPRDLGSFEADVIEWASAGTVRLFKVVKGQRILCGVANLAPGQCIQLVKEKAASA